MIVLIIRCLINIATSKHLDSVFIILLNGESMKVLKWFLKSILFGIVFLFVFNLIGRYLNLNIPINIWTILIIGTLRMPGAATILILSFL